MNLYLNGINPAFVDDRRSKNGHRFVSVRMACKQSLDGYASITVNPRQRIKNKADNSLYNIYLGESDKTRKVNMLVDNGRGPIYADIKMTNAEVYQIYQEGIAERTAKAKAAAKAAKNKLKARG